MDARVWFGPRVDTARAWGPAPGEPPRWVADAGAAVPFDDPTDLWLALGADEAAADPEDLAAEGLAAGAADDGSAHVLGDSDSTGFVPYYQSDDYVMFQANQAYLNAMYGTTNTVDWNLNGIVGY